MPKIPLSNKTFLDTRHDVVHAPNAPGMDFGMDTARNLGRAADLAGRAGDNIWNAVKSAVGARADFLKQMEHQEDVLAATEDRNLFNRLNGELNNQLANTPGATDEEKQSWIEGYRQKYEDERKPFLDRMSGTFRKQHDAEMSGLFIRANDDRMRVLIQGRVQRVTDLTLSQLKDAGLRMDEVEYRRILDNAQNGGVPLFSAEKRAELEQNYYHLADFGLAKRAVEANTPDIDAKLAERGKDGKYKNYPHLHEAERNALARTAKTNRINREAELDAQFLADLNSGALTVTPESLEEDFDKGDISARQYNRRLAWVEGKIAADRAAEAKSAKARDAANAKWREDRKNAFKLDLYFTQISSDPHEAARQRQELEDRVTKDFKGDAKTTLELLNDIKGAVADGLAGKGEFSTPTGKQVLDFIKDKYTKSNGEYRGLKYDPKGLWNTENSQEFMQARYFEIVDLSRQMLREGKTLTEIQPVIEKQVEAMNEGKIKFILDRGGGKIQQALVECDLDPVVERKRASNGDTLILRRSGKKERIKNAE